MATRYIGDTNAQMYSNLMPAGVVLPFAGATAPTGWLLCDGTSISRATYPALFTAIGTAHGTADGNSFNVPDYRGRFLRGLDGTAGRDPDKASRTAAATGGNTGNNVGSVQGDVMQGHAHSFSPLYYNAPGPNSGGILATGGADAGVTGTSVGAPTTSGSNGTPRTSSETRPVNAAVNYIIKY